MLTDCKAAAEYTLLAEPAAPYRGKLIRSVFLKR